MASDRAAKGPSSSAFNKDRITLGADEAITEEEIQGTETPVAPRNACQYIHTCFPLPLQELRNSHLA